MTRAWTHRDLVKGRCTVEQYVADLKADVDARLGFGTRHDKPGDPPNPGGGK